MTIAGGFANAGVVTTPAVSAAGVIWIPTGDAASVGSAAGTPPPVAAFSADGSLVELSKGALTQRSFSRYSRVCGYSY